MPHVVIKCYRGRSKEQLQRTADKVAECIAEELVVSQNVVSVSIEEIDREKWDEVYRKDIYGNRENLYVEPGYTID